MNYKLLLSFPTILFLLSVFPIVLPSLSLSKFLSCYTFVEQSERVEYEMQFRGILQALMMSLRQPDLNIFKANLTTLLALNETWKLFHKV